MVDKPLHGHIRTQEFIDIALMAAAFEQRVILVFEADGVYALLKQQTPELIGLKNASPILKALELYDINDVWVEEESMLMRGIQPEAFEIGVKVMPRQNLKQQMLMADQVFSF